MTLSNRAIKRRIQYSHKYFYSQYFDRKFYLYDLLSLETQHLHLILHECRIKLRGLAGLKRQQEIQNITKDQRLESQINNYQTFIDYAYGACTIASNMRLEMSCLGFSGNDSFAMKDISSKEFTLPDRFNRRELTFEIIRERYGDQAVMDIFMQVDAITSQKRPSFQEILEPNVCQ